MNVVDAVAPTLPALLRQLEGYKTKDPQRPFTLHLAGAQITNVSPGFFTRFLNALIDPNLLSLLFLAGIGGIVFEVFHPGVVLPGALGAVALVTALFGFSILPTDWAGFALIVLGLALLVIDAHVVTHGALTVSGLIALAVGMVMLFHNAPAPYKIDTWFVVAVTASIGGFMAFALGKAVQARRRPSAMPTMVGAEGVARSDGLVFVRGELWQAATDDGAPLNPGTHVLVDDIEGLRLESAPGIGSRRDCRDHRHRRRRLSASCSSRSSAIKVVREYERGVVFRLGRLLDPPKGPGLFILIPIVDRMVKVDLRTITLNIPPQEVITKDNVPARVNAVAYFRIVDPKAAIVNIENFMVATSQIAQTTLRSVLGQHLLDELLSERDKINAILQEIIDEATAPWGIKVSIVEVKDVEIPSDMQRAMARQAEAERERRAKVINAEGEFQASERLKDAALVIENHPIALQLRYLQTLLELGASQATTIVFPAPIDLFKPFLERADAIFELIR